MKQILLALSHLHENGVVHRNLKPENLFVDGRGSIYTIKISDCGTRNWYRVFPEDKDPEVRAIGDGAYVAPEVLAQKDFSDRMDLYSVGVLTCHMLVGVLPMTAANAPNLAAPQLEKVSSVGVQFLSGMLKENPAERLSLSQALDHPWIKSFETLPTHPIGRYLIKSFRGVFCENALTCPPLQTIEIAMQVLISADSPRRTEGRQCSLT